MKGRYIFLEHSPKTVDVIFCSAEHKSGIYITIPSRLGSVHVPLAEFYLSSRYLPFFHSRPFPCNISCVNVRELVEKYGWEALLNPS